MLEEAALMLVGCRGCWGTGMLVVPVRVQVN